jgi:hypothetical protein
MVLFVLTGQAPPILVVTLVVMAYLAGYELWRRATRRMPAWNWPM